MNTSELDSFVVDELAATLKVKKGWIYGCIHAGTLPFPYFKLGNQLRFRKKDILEFVERQIENTTPILGKRFGRAS
jgi:excisionase family DNA binding protein